jgi:hypothetical protein
LPPPPTAAEARELIKQLQTDAAGVDQQYTGVREQIKQGRAQLRLKQADVQAQTEKVERLKLQVGQIALAQNSRDAPPSSQNGARTLRRRVRRSASAALRGDDQPCLASQPGSGHDRIDQLGQSCHPRRRRQRHLRAPTRTHRAPADVDHLLCAPDRCLPTEMIFGLATCPRSGSPETPGQVSRVEVGAGQVRPLDVGPVRSTSLRMASTTVPKSGRQLPKPRPQNTLGGAWVFHDLWGRVEAHCRPS